MTKAPHQAAVVHKEVVLQVVMVRQKVILQALHQAGILQAVMVRKAVVLQLAMVDQVVVAQKDYLIAKKESLMMVTN